ncbi:peptidyl-tRNA hydrolase domain-containing protein 1 [Mortierella alpina]|nr:peptidyl-tRNA hydrolase domain-containing protein 1 [Mortierella alpina]
MADPLTMFIVIRKDLIKTLGWSTGSVIAQACHASTAVLHKTRDLHDTREYLADLHNMHKVVLEVRALKSSGAIGFISKKPGLRPTLLITEESHYLPPQVKNLPQLESLAASLSTLDVPHVTWREQPEDILTCISTSPIRRNQEVKDAFKKCSLFRS